MSDDPQQRVSIFTKIVAGEIPSHKVYEDDHVYAFLDIGPLSRGHTLLIPKVCYRTLDEVPAEVGAALGRVMPGLCKAVMVASGATACNVLQNNGSLAHQAVDHVHFHLIPKFEGDGPGAGLGIVWQSIAVDEKVDELRAAIASAMG